MSSVPKAAAARPALPILSVMAAVVSRSHRRRACRVFCAASAEIASGGDEFIPLAYHVVVLVHDSVPAGNGSHAVVVGAAVALGAGLLQDGAVRRLDVADSCLAFHPVAPFISCHVGLGGGENGGIIALAIQIGAGPAGEIPVDEFIGPIEFWSCTSLRYAETGSP